MQKLHDDEWLRLFDEYENFEGTLKDFCIANGINDKTFYSKRRKMIGSHDNNNKIQIVPIVAEANNDALNFVIVNGNKIEFNNSLTHDQLSAIIKGLTQ